MKLNGLQVLQFLGMFVGPTVLFVNAPEETAAIWSCVVVALLFIGVSICSVANAIGDREAKGRKWTQ